MISDIRAGRLADDTMERHFEYLRHLKGRREIIVNEIQKANSRHRGPGTPGYHDLDKGKAGTGGRPLPSAAKPLPPSPEGEGFWRGGGQDVDH